MKRKIILLALTVQFSTELPCFGQIAPIKINKGANLFQSFESADTVDIANVIPGNSEPKKDDKIRMTTHYSRIENAFQKLSENQSEKLEKINFESETVSTRLANAKSEQDVQKILLDVRQLEYNRNVILDSVKYYQKFVKQYHFRRRTTKSVNLFFVRNEYDAELYYTEEIQGESAKFFNNFLLSVNPEDGKVSLYNEIISDYIKPMRFSVGVLISNKDTEKVEEDGVITTDEESVQEDALQRLVGGGGNTIMNLSYPFLWMKTPDNSFFLKMQLSNKFSVDLPAVGTESGEFAFNNDVAIEGTVIYTGANRNIGFFANYRLGRIIYGNDVFFDNLLIDNEDTFSLNFINGGLILNSNIMISYKKFFGGRLADDIGGSLAVNIIPNN